MSSSSATIDGKCFATEHFENIYFKYCGQLSRSLFVYEITEYDFVDTGVLLTAASVLLKLSSQTVPQAPLIKTSSLPFLESPPANRT